MKFMVIDVANGSNVLGGAVAEDNAILQNARPVDESYPYYRDLKVHEKGLYEFLLSGSRTVCEVLRVE